MESVHIQRVLDASGWHKGRTCEILKISSPRLRRMIRQYKLSPPATLELEPEDDHA